MVIVLFKNKFYLATLHKSKINHNKHWDINSDKIIEPE